jgi:molybdopterin-guanine dinucleotide biosynthesis protein A
MLPVFGTTLWEYQLAKLQALSPRNLFVSSNENLPSGNYTLLRDREAGLGPLAGIAAGLSAIQEGERLLVLAVDMPRVPVDFLRGLLLFSKMGVILKAEGHFIGTVAAYPKSVLPAIEAALSSEDRSIQRLVRATMAEWAVYETLPQEEIYLANLNEPTEYRRFLADNTSDRYS